jgi:pSer/pThr/pTyr-binding forkhead associated (FHA) protein
MDVKLVFFRPNGERKDFPVSKSAAVIGRGENCDLRVPVVSVSRRHCELTVTGSQLKVKDLASSNGTYVNNRRVNEAQLHAGDRLVIGPIVLTVQIDGMPEEIKPVKTRAEKLAEGVKEEVVELEADVLAKSEGAPADAGVLETQVVETAEDPISALEALAAESQKKPKRK